MARILFLTQVLPYPLNTGARVRQYYVLRHLSRAHDITLVSFTRADDRSEHITHLQQSCAAVHTVPMMRSARHDVCAVVKGTLRRRPFVIVRDEMAAMQALLERLWASRPFDVVHADQVSMAQYGLLGRSIRRVLDLHNAMYLVTQRLAEHESNPLKRLVVRREARALAHYEASLCERYDRIVFVTGEDRCAIQAQLPDHRLTRPDLPPLSSKFRTIPICLDPTDQQPIAPLDQPFRIMALGLMFWPPNAEGVAWFAREVWPQVHARWPALRLTIAGKNPLPPVSRLNGTDGIEITGYVENLEPLLAETAVFVVPLRAGGGMRVKILDAWCWGLPIVSTRIGAEGIAVEDGENILLADSSEAFAAAINRVLAEPGLAQRLRVNGRRRVEDQYDWRKVYAAWDEVYADLFDSRI